MARELKKTLNEELHGAHALQTHGGRAAGAGHRRGGARRDQDDVAYRPAAGGAGRDDRRRAGRHVPGRAAGLRHGRPVRRAAEGRGGGGGEILRGHPRRAGHASARQRAAGQRRDPAARWCRTSTCRVSRNWRRRCSRCRSISAPLQGARRSRSYSAATGSPRTGVNRASSSRRCSSAFTRFASFTGRSRGSCRAAAPDRHRDIQRFRPQRRHHRAQITNILLDQRPLQHPLLLAAEQIERGAAQPLAMPQHPEQRQRRATRASRPCAAVLSPDRCPVISGGDRWNTGFSPYVAAACMRATSYSSLYAITRYSPSATARDSRPGSPNTCVSRAITSFTSAR